MPITGRDPYFVDSNQNMTLYDVSTYFKNNNNYSLVFTFTKLKSFLADFNLENSVSSKIFKC